MGEIDSIKRQCELTMGAYSKGDISAEGVRRILNKVESEHKQAVFIKTNICPYGHINVEMWVKVSEWNG